MGKADDEMQNIFCLRYGPATQSQVGALVTQAFLVRRKQARRPLCRFAFRVVFTACDVAGRLARARSISPLLALAQRLGFSIVASAIYPYSNFVEDDVVLRKALP